MIRILALLTLLISGPVAARPLAYVLDPAQSDVGFQIAVGQSPLSGTMPVTRADITLDFDRAAASHVAVTLAPADARMALPFATEAMRGPDILATGRYPEIRFESTAIRAEGDGATVDGLITIRGVTRPIRLKARLTRPKGTAQGFRDELTIRLTGTVNRRDFGANGFADLVGDGVGLNIKAHIRLAAGN